MFLFLSRAAAAASCASLLIAAATPQEPPRPAEPVRPARRAARIVPARPMPPLSQEELRKRRAEKLAKPVFAKAAWRTDYDAARKEARETGKLILVYFTRSYAH
ncbi:MAG: hypothetical protein Fur0037_16980 [Planctomycetota bacterium]